MGNRKIDIQTENFANEVYTNFYRDLTDQLFLYIQNDNDLKDKYNNLISKFTKETINQDLGQLFKELFNVDNLKRNYNPESSLINSYTQHTTPK